MAVHAQVAPRLLADYLLSHGRTVVTLAEAAEVLGLTDNAASDALTRLRRAGQFFSPTPGLYVAIPPQYRLWGAVPAMDFIDQLMAAVGRVYYVGLLSAAELHGAAHQRPQVFQVMVERQYPDRDFGRVRLRFFTNARAADVPVTLINSATTQVRVSTPEVAALDLASRPNDSGGLSNVATVIGELAEDGKLDPSLLVLVAAMYPQSSVRRLGWLLDLLEIDLDQDRLLPLLSESPGGRPNAYLTPGGPRSGRTNRRWGLVENTEVEPDL